MSKLDGLNLQDVHSGDRLGRLADEPDKKTPFDVYVFENVLAKDKFDELRRDINANVKLSPKNNDLYKFNQSKDLKSEIKRDKLTPLISDFSEMMLSEARPRLEQLSHLLLSKKKFDITASRYDQGDYLLCHNDDIKDSRQARVLAFIFYLNTRPWTKDDGGALILYDSDESGEPFQVNNYIHPKPNSLIVFRTSPTSWHSVQEVLCKNDVRLSINGWFHSQANDTRSIANEQVNQLTIEPSPFTFLRPTPLDERLEKFFMESINGEYMTEKTCFLIRRQFKRKSELNLPGFLIPKKYQEISQALREAAASSSENLQQVGPYNKRNYFRFKVEKLPQVCRDLYDAFKSELFFILLSRFTGLDLQQAHLIHEKQIIDSSSSSSSSSDEDEDDDDSGNDLEEDDDSSSSVGEVGQSSNESVEEEDEDKDGDATSGDAITGPGHADQDLKPTTSKSNGKDGAAKAGAEAEAADVQEAKKEKRKEKTPCDPLARLEFRHLDGGTYTLIHDYAFELGERSALDVVLHFNHDFGVKFEHGGYISYLDVASEDLTTTSKDGSSADLLTIEPESNSLSLVYRSDGTTEARFLKYITHSHKSSYQDLSCVYYERPEDLPHRNGGSCLEPLPEAHGVATPSTNESAIKRAKLES